MAYCCASMATGSLMVRGSAARQAKPLRGDMTHNNRRQRGPTSPQMPTSWPGGTVSRGACSVGPLYRPLFPPSTDPTELAMLRREVVGFLSSLQGQVCRVVVKSLLPTC